MGMKSWGRNDNQLYISSWPGELGWRRSRVRRANHPLVSPLTSHLQTTNLCTCVSHQPLSYSLKPLIIFPLTVHQYSQTISLLFPVKPYSLFANHWHVSPLSSLQTASLFLPHPIPFSSKPPASFPPTTTHFSLRLPTCSHFPRKPLASFTQTTRLCKLPAFLSRQPYHHPTCKPLRCFPLPCFMLALCYPRLGTRGTVGHP